ncbi:hypothetical protein K1T71_000715 [Dendrolimus kikuchii]|uniref:Uncharacterized protein n=1 Tax=Dendrolimus kikuchii TaxID=765133 RepID=A0ACC1DK62_9NEOP|nr:hypothetical protein K1T71_000715 [Dendrolimus kikuchii]
MKVGNGYPVSFDRNWSLLLMGKPFENQSFSIAPLQLGCGVGAVHVSAHTNSRSPRHSTTGNTSRKN